MPRFDEVRDIYSLAVYMRLPLKSKKYKSPGTSQIWPELFQIGFEKLSCDTHKVIRSPLNKE